MAATAVVLSLAAESLLVAEPVCGSRAFCAIWGEVITLRDRSLSTRRDTPCSARWPAGDVFSCWLDWGVVVSITKGVISMK